MYQDRDLSWLAFNERIIQEAGDETNDLSDRMKFLAIYSSNLEEFYKVRVASHRFAKKYKGDKKNKFGYRPSYILSQIAEIVDQQQEQFGKIFKEDILPEYAKNGVQLLNASDLSETDLLALRSKFNKIKSRLVVQEITKEEALELENQAVYLYLVGKNRQWIVKLNYKEFGRFISLSDDPKAKRIVQLDDVVRMNSELLVKELVSSYAIKISRDAELYIEEEQEDDLIKKIKNSIRKRDTGLPSRLLFDETIPFKWINLLRKKSNIDLAGLIPGGTYHNFYDFFGFPKPNIKNHKTIPIIPSKRLDSSANWFDIVKEAPIFLSFPYQSYNYVVRFLEKACEDPSVEEINITLYRVAGDSAICKALEKAAQVGKKVFVLDEVMARFDEESNIFWGERLEKAGATVRYGVPNLKVHAKIFTVKRREEKKVVTYSYLGTGNFNEKTAGIYADHALITSNNVIRDDLHAIFDFLKGEAKEIVSEKLLVSPFHLRLSLQDKIQREIEFANKGISGHMQIKLNSLEDTDMIDWIRKAADAGVKVDLVIRGICCYVPLTEKQKQNITVVCVIDNFLEHTRIYHFHNNGNPELYLASADWMTRNLSKRIEVAFPIESQKEQKLLLDEFEYQLNDNVKGRMVATNKYIEGNQSLSSQTRMFTRVEQYEKIPGNA